MGFLDHCLQFCDVFFQVFVPLELLLHWLDIVPEFNPPVIEPHKVLLIGIQLSPESRSLLFKFLDLLLQFLLPRLLAQGLLLVAERVFVLLLALFLLQLLRGREVESVLLLLLLGVEVYGWVVLGLVELVCVFYQTLHTRCLS